MFCSHRRRKVFPVLRSLFLTLFLCVSGLSVRAADVSAEGHGISLTVPEDFVLLSHEDPEKNRALMESLGLDADKFRENLKKSGTLLFAVTPDGKRQINLKVLENSLTEQIYDLTTLTEENRETAAQSLIDELRGTENMTVLSQSRSEVSGTRFYEVRVRVASENGEFCFVQYFSVFNGKYYALVYYNSAPALSESDLATAKAVFESLTVERVPKRTAADFATVMQMIFIFLVMAACIAGVVIIIRGFVKEWRIRKREAEASLDYLSRRR